MNASSSRHSYPSKMEPVQMVYDEERIKILLDPTRQKILQIMTVGRDGLSVIEIAEQLRTSPQRIYHHVDKLVEYGFLMISREQRKRRSITTYYQKTAEAFVVSYSTDRGYIEDQALINHYIEVIRTILDVKFDQELEDGLTAAISQLGRISEEVFKKYTHNTNDELQRHVIENLYFIIELVIFYQHSEGKNVLEELTGLLRRKLS